MSSTRNRNMPGNFCLEKEQNRNIESYLLYANSSSGVPYSSRFPGNGLGGARIARDKLSFNSVDTESYLFGINSTNLIDPQPPFVAEPNYLRTENLYDGVKIPTETPVYIRPNQRPFIP